MSTSKYPNRDALREANDIYLDVMCQFVSECLDKVQGTTAAELIRDALRLSSHDDIGGTIEISDIAYLIRKYWYDSFEEQFDIIDPHYEVRSATGLIVEGRNRASHRPWDLDPEFTRTQLFLIAELLGKINKPNEHREVMAIRDELFPNDTKERLVKMETENATYQKSLEKSKKELETAESEKIKYEKDNATLSKQVDEKEKRHRKLSKQLKNAKAEKDKYKKNLTGTKQRLEKSESVQADYKKQLKIISKELELVKVEKNASEEYRTDTRNLLTTVAIDDQSVFPSFGTDSDVRILDRRGTDKHSYLSKLLDQKQPTIIYVQSKEKIHQLLDLVGPEKAVMIENHSEQTSEAEKIKILEKLENRELIAVVSNTTFFTLPSLHCVEHFVFCHLVPSLDTFFKRCQPAFTSGKNNYLHLIYDSKQDIEGLTQKYPDREVLEKLYPKLTNLVETNGNFIEVENLYSELDIAKLGIETGLAIFEELQLIERNSGSIKLLPPVGKKLDESEIYCRGEKLKKETEDFKTFQLEHSIEQIWEKMLEELKIDSEQTFKIPLKISETEGNYLKDPQTQPEQSTEVEVDKNTKTKYRKKKFSIAERYVAETTVEERNGIAAKMAHLRINATGSKPLAWREIREKLGLQNDQFHKAIRHSEGYRKAVIRRIKSLKAQEGGWEYKGKLEVLTGIELTEKELE